MGVPDPLYTAFMQSGSTVSTPCPAQLLAPYVHTCKHRHRCGEKMRILSPMRMSIRFWVILSSFIEQVAYTLFTSQFLQKALNVRGQPDAHLLINSGVLPADINTHVASLESHGAEMKNGSADLGGQLE